MELDASDYEGFNRYKRWFTEHEKVAHAGGELPRSDTGDRRASYAQVLCSIVEEEADRNPQFLKQYPELGNPAVVRRLARVARADWAAKSKMAAEARRRVNSHLLGQFDVEPWNGPEDWVHKRTFKQALREVLSDYLADPYSRPFAGRVAVKPEEFRPSLVADSLSWKALGPLRLLRTLAEQGDNRALQLLAEIIIPLVKVVNERAGKDPKALGCMPQRYRFWPALKSEHPDFDEDHCKLLKELRVGQDFPLLVTERARWTAQDAVGRWAIHLCQEIYIMQDGHWVDEKSKAWEVKLLALKPFSSQTWEGWWEVARGLLLDEYIDVVQIPELRDTVRGRSEPRSPGRVRKRVLQALKDKFKSMAGQNKI
jgi:hypothetical protein